MSTTNGPFTLNLGAEITTPNPTAQGGNPAASVQIQNSSVFVLQVLASGLTYTLQPFIAQTIPLGAGGGAPIQITPTQNPSGTTDASDTATLVWLLTGESPPMQDGPLTAAAILATVNPSATLVAAAANVTVVNGAAQTGNFDVPVSTRSLVVITELTNTTAGQLNGIELQTVVTGVVSNDSLVNTQVLEGVTLETFISPNKVGAAFYGIVDSVGAVSWAFSSPTVAGLKITYWVIALPDDQFLGQLTSPIVVQVAENVDQYATAVISSTTGAVTLVPGTPPEGFLWKVRNFLWNNSNATAATPVTLVGETSGAEIGIIQIPEQVAGTSYSYPPLEYNMSEGLNVSTTSATAIRVFCTYRAVPAGAYAGIVV